MAPASLTLLCVSISLLLCQFSFQIIFAFIFSILFFSCHNEFDACWSCFAISAQNTAEKKSNGNDWNSFKDRKKNQCTRFKFKIQIGKTSQSSMSLIFAVPIDSAHIIWMVFHFIHTDACVYMALFLKCSSRLRALLNGDTHTNGYYFLMEFNWRTHKTRDSICRFSFFQYFVFGF